MRIEYLEEFLAFADELNFTKAARRLHITQPALSKHIMSMEDELGFKLVDRDASPLALTLAGATFAEKMFDVVVSYRRGEREATRAARAASPVKVHEYLAGSKEGIARLGRITDIPFEYVSIPANMSTVDAVLSGTADIGNLIEARLSDSMAADLDALGIGYLRLWEAPYSICMSKSNPLAVMGDLSRRDLERVEIAVFSSMQYRALTDAILYMLGDDLNLSFKLVTAKSDSAIYSMDLGNMVHICGADVNMRHLQYRDDVVLVDHLVDAELTCPSWAIWSKHNANPDVERFVGRLSEFSNTQEAAVVA